MSKTTENYGLTKPEVGEFFSLETWNGNMDKIDEQMKTRENATDALQEPEFTVADKRENIASKEKMPKILGKIAKFFADLKVVAFTGSYKDLTDKPSAATQTADGMLSATDKKAIDLLGAPIGSCATGRATAAKVATLKNFKLAVGLSIAVKFTDTAGTANPASGNLTLNVNGTGAKTIGYFRNGSKSALTYASGAFFCNNATHIFTYDGVYWLCMDWNADNNTTYANFVKSGTGAKAGLVPAPSTTAGATKYLREDGTWAVPPDTKTSIINNQTTTKAGYALDARQANPNIDGTLAKQVADLNGSLNGKIGKIRCGNSDKGITITYFGIALVIIYQGGSLGGALYVIHSTKYIFEYSKIFDSLSAYKVTFSSVDLETGTFKIEWSIAGYSTYLIPLC